nr:MAG TPA: hypothetical protein [Caudoviricetes sp.]
MEKELEFSNEPIERFENLKKISGDLREVVIKKYPELREDEIEYLTQLLGMELKILFLDINSREKENVIFHRNYGTYGTNPKPQGNPPKNPRK